MNFYVDILSKKALFCDVFKFNKCFPDIYVHIWQAWTRHIILMSSITSFTKLSLVNLFPRKCCGQLLDSLQVSASHNLDTTLAVKTLFLGQTSGSSVSFLQRLTDKNWFHPNLLGTVLSGQKVIVGLGTLLL